MLKKFHSRIRRNQDPWGVSLDYNCLPDSCLLWRDFCCISINFAEVCWVGEANLLGNSNFKLHTSPWSLNPKSSKKLSCPNWGTWTKEFSIPFCLDSIQQTTTSVFSEKLLLSVPVFGQLPTSSWVCHTARPPSQGLEQNVKDRRKRGHWILSSPEEPHQWTIQLYSADRLQSCDRKVSFKGKITEWKIR